MEGTNAEYSQLLYEAKVLKELQGKPGIPIVYWSGTQGEFDIIVG